MLKYNSGCWQDPKQTFVCYLSHPEPSCSQHTFPRKWFLAQGEWSFTPTGDPQLSPTQSWKIQVKNCFSPSVFIKSPPGALGWGKSSVETNLTTKEVQETERMSPDFFDNFFLLCILLLPFCLFCELPQILSSEWQWDVGRVVKTDFLKCRITKERVIAMKSGLERSYPMQ